MKVEDPSALLVQWFYHKPTYLPKGDESSWQNYTKYAARSATTKRTFIATEKMLMVIKSISAKSADISGHRIPPNVFIPERRITLPAQFAGKQPSCITTENITPTIPAPTKNAAIPCSYQSLRPFLPHPCPNCSVRRISSGCAIPSM